MPPCTIAIATHKGGTGKTVTAMGLSAALARAGGARRDRAAAHDERPGRDERDAPRGPCLRPRRVCSRRRSGAAGTSWQAYPGTRTRTRFLPIALPLGSHSRSLL